MAVTVLPVPTSAVSKVDVPAQVTTSLPSTPVRAQTVAAAVLPSYGLPDAVITAVSGAAVMLAAVVAVVADSV